MSVNLTVMDATAQGNAAAWPGGASAPLASILNFGAGQTRANNAILALSQDGLGTLTVRANLAAAGSVQLLLDVTGYFE